VTLAVMSPAERALVLAHFGDDSLLLRSIYRGGQSQRKSVRR
jgi:hypothetical protein